MNAIGLWLVKTQTVSSGVATVSVNDCFSADYKTYRIIMELNGTTAGAFARFRVRVGGADLTGSNYYRYGYTTGFASALTSYNGGPETSFSAVGQWGGSLASTAIMDIYNPYATQRTGYLVNTNDVGSGASYNLNGVVDVTTSYTGFSVIASAGNFSGGTIRVFGYRD
jgi:hypothetical protein